LRRYRRDLLCTGTRRDREQRIQMLHLMDELMVGPPPRTCIRARTQEIVAAAILTPAVTNRRGLLVLLLRWLPPRRRRWLM
tara:strand:+ start:253 stop:495 length:243 start_codon:yes stop_codon:yes gene_type:complete